MLPCTCAGSVGAATQVGEGMGVLVERCRYLEQSGCASICINSCKVPTQVRELLPRPVATIRTGSRAQPAVARQLPQPSTASRSSQLVPTMHCSAAGCLGADSGVLPFALVLCRIFLLRTWACP